MDFLDPKKRRAHRNRLFIGYALIAVILAVMTTFIVLAARGYGIDRKTGEIIQNAIVFMNAAPEAATMYIDGKDRGQTEGRFVLPEGKHSFELRRDGYRTWSKELTLEGESIERLVYPFLFPNELKSADVQLYGSVPDLTTNSPDRRWILTHRVAAMNSIEVTDTSTDTNDNQTVLIPEPVMPVRSGEQKLELVEWSTDNRRVLLKHTFPDGMEYIVFDRENPAESINLNTQLGVSYTRVALRDKKADQVYVLTADKTLQLIDVESKSVTAIAKNVLEFFPYQDDMVLYVTPEGAPAGKVLARMYQTPNTYTLRTMPESSAYLLNIAEFNNRMMVVVGNTMESMAVVYENPLGFLRKNPPQQPVAKTYLKVPANALAVSFSTNARFIALQSGSTFAVYDAEHNRHYRYTLDIPIAADARAVWMDGHRLTTLTNGKVAVFEFDGTNLQTLVAVSAGPPAMFDRDYRTMFTVSPSVTVKDKPALVRTELVVER